MFADTLARRWRVAAIVAVVTMVVTSLVAFSQPRVYTARTVLLVGDVLVTFPEYEDVLLAQRLAPTYAALLRTRPVADAVATSLGLDLEPEALLGRIDVRTAPDSLIIEVTAADPSPVTAAAIANGFADELVRRTPVIDGPTGQLGPSVTVVETATPPPAPESGPLVGLVAIGGVLAIVFALGVIFLLALVSPRVEDAQPGARPVV